MISQDNLKWGIGICVGLVLGGSVTYSTLNTTDAELCGRVDMLLASQNQLRKELIHSDDLLSLRITNSEDNQQQVQKELNMLRVGQSKLGAQLQGTITALESLGRLVKENTDSNKELAIIIARMDVRQTLNQKQGN